MDARIELHGPGIFFKQIQITISLKLIFFSKPQCVLVLNFDDCPHAVVELEGEAPVDHQAGVEAPGKEEKNQIKFWKIKMWEAKFAR